MAEYTYEYGVTPARLDMLIAIARDPTGIRQAELRATLDVCGPVVSVMLDSLSELGYVERHKRPGLHQGNQVTLTKLGRTVFDEIVSELLHDGFTEHMVRQILSSAPGSDGHTARLLARTRRFLAFLRDRLLDRSTLLYPCYLEDGARSPAHPYDPSVHDVRSWGFRRDDARPAATP